MAYTNVGTSVSRLCFASIHPQKALHYCYIFMLIELNAVGIFQANSCYYEGQKILERTSGIAIQPKIPTNKSRNHTHNGENSSDATTPKTAHISLHPQFFCIFFFREIRKVEGPPMCASSNLPIPPSHLLFTCVRRSPLSSTDGPKAEHTVAITNAAWRRHCLRTL